MNYQKAIFIINDDVRALRVQYQPELCNPRKGDDVDAIIFKTLDPAIKKGDLVVVPTKTRHKATVVKVTDIDIDPGYDLPGECRWVIQRVNMTDFDLLKEREEEAVSQIRQVEDRRRRKELRQAMEADAAESLKALPIYNVTIKDEGK